MISACVLRAFKPGERRGCLSPPRMGDHSPVLYHGISGIQGEALGAKHGALHSEQKFESDRSRIQRSVTPSSYSTEQVVIFITTER